MQGLLNLRVFAGEGAKGLDRFISLIGTAGGKLVGKVHQLMIDIGSLLNAGLTQTGCFWRFRIQDQGLLGNCRSSDQMGITARFVLPARPGTARPRPGLCC